MNRIDKFFYKFSIYREIKWMIQRIHRGWDDRVLWNVDHYLSVHIPVWLTELKKMDQCPSNLLPNSDIDDWDTQKKEWDRIIDEIIIGFKAAEDIIDGNSPAWNSYFEESEKRFGKYSLFEDKPESDELLKELDIMKKNEKEIEELMKKFDSGMELFKKNFFNFWS
jgi:hypothetical protein